jgi:hypothetical protein
LDQTSSVRKVSEMTLLLYEVEVRSYCLMVVIFLLLFEQTGRRMAVNAPIRAIQKM